MLTYITRPKSAPVFLTPKICKVRPICWRHGWCKYVPCRPSTYLSSDRHPLGFPCFEGEQECQELRERIAISSEGATVKLATPDTIEVTFPAVPITPTISVPGVKRAFESVMPFDHLQKSRVITFRIALNMPGREQRNTTMVFYGAKQGSRYQLKSVWPVAPGFWPEHLYQETTWPTEEEFLACVEAHKIGETQPMAMGETKWINRHIFPIGDVKKFNLMVWFFNPPSRKVRFLLERLSVAIGVLLVGLLALYWFPSTIAWC